MELKKRAKTRLKSVKRILKRDLIEKNPSEIIPSSYFARFRFNLDELLNYLKESSGKLFIEIPQVYQCLDDLGYWSLVRASNNFIFTQELELSLVAQFNLLNKVFEYHLSDVLIWGDVSHNNSERFLVKVVEKVNDNEQELFRVEFLKSGATLLVSRYELDYWNASGSSLPVDTLLEVIDWSNDYFWHKRLNDFKLFMVQNNFKFNFLVSDSEILNQREELFSFIKSFYSLKEGNLYQRNRGIGLLSCGSGSEQENLLVLTFALQALGQPFGIVSRLWGKFSEFDFTPEFLKIKFGHISSVLTLNYMNRAIEDLELRPIQRPLSEVLKRVLAKGPFGKWESLIYIKPESNTNIESLLINTDSDS